MALLSQALPLGYLLSPHSAFQGHAAHTARWPAMLSPNGSSDTCISDGVFHIPMPCFHGALPVYLKVVTTFLHNASRRTRRALHASCESPWHSLAKHCLLDTCFLLTVPFRGMLLTPQGGPRCLAPTAHQIPVYLMVFSTFLCRAFTAHYLYTPRYCYISPLYFTAQRRLEVHDRVWSVP